MEERMGEKKSDFVKISKQNLIFTMDSSQMEAWSPWDASNVNDMTMCLGINFPYWKTCELLNAFFLKTNIFQAKNAN